MSAPSIPEEYARYSRSSGMELLAKAAHGSAYCGQTSSVTPEELTSALHWAELRAESHLIDIGCGNGCFSIAIANAFGCRVTGIDLSNDLVAVATARAASTTAASRIRFRTGDFTCDPLADAAADVLLCVGSLYWNPNLGQTLAHWTGHSVSDARLVIFLNVAVTSLTPRQQAAVGHTHFVSKDELAATLAAVRFQSRFDDHTATYILWLRRWCRAMKEHDPVLREEFGVQGSARMRERFETYLELAEAGSVKRAVIAGRRRVDASQ